MGKPSGIGPRARRFAVLTGASGSGKTTLAKRCGDLCPSLISVRHFDAIQIPSTEQMIAEYGSTEEWQRCKTFEWFENLAQLDAPDILFEGQSRISFIVAAISAVGILNARIILVDCDDATRMRRLRTDRAQPELANETMLKWAAYLRREAQQFACETLDTSKSAVDEGTTTIIRHFR